MKAELTQSLFQVRFEFKGFGLRDGRGWLDRLFLMVG
jgi:hypothetical protein